MNKIIRKIFSSPLNYHESDARVHRRFLRRSPIVHHYCPHTYNAGDHFVILSLRRALRKRLSNVIFIPKAIAGNRGWGKPAYLKGENIAFSNLNADAVMVGGSDHYKDWSLRIDGEEIQKLQPPLFLLGLGASSKGAGQPPEMSRDRYWTDLRKTNEHAAVSTVRDLGTQEMLEQAGITKSVMTGCPSMYLTDPTPFAHRPDGPMILTFPFPVDRNSQSERYRRLQEIIRSLLRDYGESRIIISCHDDRDVPVAAEVFPEARIFFSNNPRQYLQLYRTALLVAGSRLHASLCAVAAGTPFININIDFRGEQFTRTFGLENWNLSLSQNDFDTALRHRIEGVISGEMHTFSEFYERKEQLREVFDSSMNDVARIIRERVPVV